MILSSAENLDAAATIAELPLESVSCRVEDSTKRERSLLAELIGKVELLSESWAGAMDLSGRSSFCTVSTRPCQ